MEEANGGNAEMAIETTNLKTTEEDKSAPKIDEPSSPMDSQAALSPPATSITNNTSNEKIIKMDEDDVNGDIKNDVNKKTDITIKRKLRKSKSNSTSSVETTTDAKQKTRGQKRKSPDIDNNNPIIDNDNKNNDDFIGFDYKKSDDDRVLKILLKLIAEVESEELPAPKRGRLLSKARQVVGGVSDEKIITKQINTLKVKNDIIGGDLSNNSVTNKSPKSVDKIDTKNPIYKEPFKYGWRRELIYKGLSDINKKRSADIYYYSPKGKKVKNMKEIGECLTTKQLTLDNFTFNKEPIGVGDPALEVIRDAKRLRSESIGGVTTPVRKTIAPGKRVSIGKKVSPVQAGKTSGGKLGSPKNSGNAAGFKVKVPIKRGSFKKEQKTPKDPESLPAQWPSTTPSRRAPAPLEKSSPPKSKRTIQKAKLQERCSIKCTLSMGLIPNLQCAICLCLYHPKCVGGTESLTKKKYICKNCLPVEAPPLTPTPPAASSAPTPPALIPISMIGSSIKPKFTLPIPSDVDAALPKTKLLKPSNSFNNQEQQVTKDRSWFARRNEYVHNHASSVAKPAQNIAVLGDKRYIVIPKNNSMSVQPAIKPRNNRFTDKSGLFSDNLLNDLREERVNQQKDSSILTEIGKNLGKSQENEQVPGDGGEIDDKKDGKEQEETSGTAPEDDGGKKSDDNSGKIEENKGDDGKNKNDDEEKENGDKQRDIVEQMETSSSKITSVQEKQKEPSPETIGTIDKKKTVAVDVDKSQYFMASICAGYNALPRIFQYLKVQELLRASRVCKMWRDLASQKSLWKTVRMKNSQVTDWNGLVECLNRHNTENLDLRKMIITGEQDICWNKLIQVISDIKSLVKLDLCRCPSTFVEDIMKNCTKIEVLNAITINDQSLSLTNIDNMINCKELRLKAINFMTINDLSSIEKLDKLTILSLTSIKDLGKQNIDVIGSLVNLEILELGECSNFPASFGTDVLVKLNKLVKIRLEKGQGTCCTFEILDGISKLEKIQELELINFDVKQGFDQCLAKCCNLKKLLIIPTYISQSATTNNMVIGGVTKLADSLDVFVWGVTRELLGVTGIFVQQSSDNNKEDSPESIPVLKPVPCIKLIEDGHDGEKIEKDDNPLNTTKPQIDVLALNKVNELLAAALPNTRVKILKIRFAATWRQSISDSDAQLQ